MKQDVADSVSEDTPPDQIDEVLPADKPKRPRGRPRNDGLPPGGAKQATGNEIPRPYYPLYKSDAPQSNQRTRSFYNYWAGLDPKFKSRTIAYVYREWPVLREEFFEGNEELKFIEKIPGEQPINDDLDLRAQFGVGKYKIHFNEQKSKITDPKGAPICVVYVDVMGDMKSYPPVDKHVSDVNRVDLAHPMNRSYVEFLRMRRMLPEQQDQESEMATQVASETVKELTGIIREQIADTKERSTQQDSTSSATGHAMKEITSGVMDAAKGIVSMTVESAKQTRADFPAPERQQDPVMAQLMPIILAKLVDSKPSEEVSVLRREIEKMREDRMASEMTQLRGEIAALRSQPQSNPGSADSTVSTIKTMRELFDELGIGANPREEAPWWSSLVASGVQFLATSGPQIIQAISMANRPAPPPPTSTVTQVPNDQPQQQANPQPAQVQAPGSLIPAIAGLDPAIVNLFMEIKTSFLNYLRANSKGDQYAALFVDNYDAVTFGQLKALGPDIIMQGLALFPPIWEQVQRENITQDRLRNFIAEFCMYEPKMESAA